MIILRNRFFSDEEEKEDKYHTGRNTAIVGGIGALGTGILGLGSHKEYKNQSDALNKKEDQLKKLKDLVDEAEADFKSLEEEEKKLASKTSSLTNAKLTFESSKRKFELESKSISNDIEGLKEKLEDLTEDFRLNLNLENYDKEKQDIEKSIEELNKKLESRTKQVNFLQININDVENKLQTHLKNSAGHNTAFGAARSYLNETRKNHSLAASERDTIEKLAKEAKSNRNSKLAWGAGITGAAALGTYLYNKHKNRQEN